MMLTDINTFSLEELMAHATETASQLKLSEPVRKRLIHLLVMERSFPQGFWHPDDQEGMTEVMQACFRDLGLGLEMLNDEFYQSLTDGFLQSEEDEDQGRRRQIDAALQQANQNLSAQHDLRRFYSFAENIPEWEADEPVWLLLTEKEEKLLLELEVLANQ